MLLSMVPSGLVNENFIFFLTYACGISGMARAGRGKAEFVRDEKDSASQLKTVVLAQLKRALQPSLTNVRMEWRQSSSENELVPVQLAPR